MAEEMSLFPPVSETDMIRGSENAAVTLTLYADYQDQPSAELIALLAQLAEKYSDDLRIVFRDFPLMLNPGHEKSAIAAQATHAAALQGKYWEMHDTLFAKQIEWSPLSIEDFEKWLSDEAIGLGLDAAELGP